MLDVLRASLHRAISTPVGDRLAPVRIGKDLARRANSALGAPLGSREELAARREARARLGALRAGPSTPRETRAVAPVVVYFEKSRGVRPLARIEELLGAKGIAYRKLDVTGDEAMLDFLVRRSGVDADDLPVVFVADEAIGTYEALVASDLSGDFARALRGEPKASPPRTSEPTR